MDEASESVAQTDDNSLPRDAAKGTAPPPFSGSSGSGFEVKLLSKSFDELHFGLFGVVRMENARQVLEAILSAIAAEPLRNVALDLSEVEYFDSSGVAILIEVRQKCHMMGNRFRVARTRPEIRRLLDLVDFDHYAPACVLAPRGEPGVLVQVGEGTEQVLMTGRDILTFIGASAVALAKDLTRPRTARWDGFWRLLEKAGTDAVPIVTSLSFLMGAILAFQAAIQLRKFGANIFVADLVSVSICVEMGPLLTAIIIAGRSGAAFAAHIGTMRVTEEIDALSVMAIDPIRYLVTPRVLAVALISPCLTLFADIVGVAGGCIVAASSLDITPTTYFNQVQKVLEVSDVLKGLTKSFAYGVEVAMIGCLRGFQVRGGAESVGSAVTSAVVTSVFVIVVTDAIFSMLFHYVRFI
ncbi:MAG: MlaE family lipid ABC transporter permease subunit [Desulfomonile sp.]|nr:MlaE family lipid ABC transporter permease subunit [Desulfomonile sp.]